MLKKIFLIFSLVVFVSSGIWPQEFGFGFGFGDDENGQAGDAVGGAGSSALSGVNKAVSVSASGEVSASLVGYFEDFSDGADSVQFGNIFSGKLNFNAQTAYAEGVINLKLTTTEKPVIIDEAYLKAFFGNFEISAGLRKIIWGKADSFGPLDVINPLDSSQIFTEMADNTSLMGVRIPRPLIHASFRFGQFSKIEGLFVPNFEPTRFSKEGKWAPAGSDMALTMEELLPPGITVNFSFTEPDTTALDYAQAGLRFTTTIGSSDIGIQYYFGRLFQPAVKISVTPVTMTEFNFNADYNYNRYHQIGLDYAQDLFGFNIRAEVAANITEDLKGDDGAVYNPSIAWSFGFDRDLFWGINLNLQVNENIRLMNDKTGSDNYFGNDFDIESGLPVTATQLTATLFKKFLRDELELRASVVWGIEDNDCAIIPALIWTKDDFKAALSAGFFAGDSKGQLGQYKDNNFLKASLTYTF
ncbi:MAG: hypothetical protein FWC03_09430 [Treponema sp.]|nr:hypothetical protein [Treponema sp.]